MKNRRLVFAILISAAALISAEQPARLTIAVNDLRGTGIDEAASTIISERLRSELINTGAFRVMERAEMKSILKEQGFQQSGACDESSCLVQAGQLLGVNRMIAGSVGAVGNFWTISLRMLNVGTGEILFTINEDYEGEFKGVVSRATARAATKLVSGAVGEIEQVALAGKKGELFIESSEGGAKIEIDGKVIPGVTPLSLSGFPAGNHEIVVRKGAYAGTEKIVLKPNAAVRISIPMQLDKGFLKVISTPAGASIFLIPTSMSVGAQLSRGEVKETGRTPYQCDSIEPGEYWLLLREKDYSESYRKISIASNQLTTFADTLVKACRYVTFTYAISQLYAPTFHWKENDYFDFEYQNLRWKTLSRMGVDISPVRYLFKPQGYAFVHVRHGHLPFG